MKKLLFVCFSLFLSLSYAQTEGAETAPLDELEEKLLFEINYSYLS